MSSQLPLTDKSKFETRTSQISRGGTGRQGGTASCCHRDRMAGSSALASIADVRHWTGDVRGKRPGHGEVVLGHRMSSVILRTKVLAESNEMADMADLTLPFANMRRRRIVPIRLGRSDASTRLALVPELAERRVD